MHQRPPPTVPERAPRAVPERPPPAVPERAPPGVPQRPQAAVPAGAPPGLRPGPRQLRRTSLRHWKINSPTSINIILATLRGVYNSYLSASYQLSTLPFSREICSIFNIYLVIFELHRQKWNGCTLTKQMRFIYNSFASSRRDIPRFQLVQSTVVSRLDLSYTKRDLKFKMQGCYLQWPIKGHYLPPRQRGISIVTLHTFKLYSYRSSSSLAFSLHFFFHGGKGNTTLEYASISI